MLVGAFGASAFGLRGGIPMEAALTSLYRAPASRANCTYSRSAQLISLSMHVHLSTRNVGGEETRIKEKYPH